MRRVRLSCDLKLRFNLVFSPKSNVSTSVPCQLTAAHGPTRPSTLLADAYRDDGTIAVVRRLCPASPSPSIVTALRPPSSPRSARRRAVKSTRIGTHPAAPRIPTGRRGRPSHMPPLVPPTLTTLSVYKVCPNADTARLSSPAAHSHLCHSPILSADAGTLPTATRCRAPSPATALCRHVAKPVAARSSPRISCSRGDCPRNAAPGQFQARRRSVFRAVDDCGPRIESA